MADARRPKSSYEDTLGTALAFLSNPWILWGSPRLEFARNSGPRTANLALPFKVLGDFQGGVNRMAHLGGEISNSLFKGLGDWQRYLAQLDREGLRCADDQPQPRV